jgi:hypothetical protein
MDFAKVLEQVEKKVSYMIRDFSAKEVKNDERFESLQTNIENAKFSINLRIDSLIEENFKIPDILQDESFKPTSFRDFMTSNLVSLQNQITRLDSHLEKDFLPKITFYDFSTLQTPRIDQLEREMHRLTEENLKTDVEIGDL